MKGITVPNKSRESFETKVAALVPGFGIDINEMGADNYAATLDAAWKNKLNDYEAALNVAYAYTMLLRQQDPVKSLKIHAERILPIQEQWVKQGHVRETLVFALDTALEASEFDTETSDLLDISDYLDIPNIEPDFPFGFRPDLPDVTKRTPTRAFMLGSYFIMLVKDAPTIAEGMGPVPFKIRYPLTLVVTEAKPGSFPLFYVTLEPGSGGNLFICSFDKHGEHANYGSSPSYKNEETFLNQAMAIIKKQFNISGNAREVGSSGNKGCLGVSLIFIALPTLVSAIGYFA